MTREDALKDVVTVIRLVPLARSARPSGESAIVANFGSRPAFVSGAVLVTTLGSAVTLTILLLLLAG